MTEPEHDAICESLMQEGLRLTSKSSVTLSDKGWIGTIFTMIAGCKWMNANGIPEHAIEDKQTGIIYIVSELMRHGSPEIRALLTKNFGDPNSCSPNASRS